MKYVFLALLLTSFFAAPAKAENALEALLNAKTIRCTVKDGFTSEFNGKEIKTEKGVFSSKPEDRVLTIAKIDLKTSAAIIIGNAGADDIVIRASEVGLNLISFTGIGAMVTGTVYSNTNSRGEYFYATSRHTQLLGASISLPSQWTGFCKILE
jgi:ABC-type amino acid transport substrate-binding protein